MIGVVLPVVLVVLTVLTGLVVTQIRRNTVDERLAANTRERIQLDSAVQTVLRWCEAVVTVCPAERSYRAFGAPNQPPAWDRNLMRTGIRVQLSSSQVLRRNSDCRTRIPNPSCVIEAATCELCLRFRRPAKNNHRVRRHRSTLAQVPHYRSRFDACAGHGRHPAYIRAE